MVDFEALGISKPWIGMPFSQFDEDGLIIGTVISMFDSDGDETFDGECAIVLVVELIGGGYLARDISKLSATDFIQPIEVN